MPTDTRTNFTQKLCDRKIPQYLGTYLAVGFGLFQFIQVIIQRFQLSNAIQDWYFLFWLLLIPAVFVFVYFGYQPNGKSVYEKKKWPHYFIIGNLILAFGLSSIFAYNSNQEDSVSNKIVELVDEEGEEIAAIVPDVKRVKTLASFQFKNSTGDNSKDWLGVAMSTLLDYSLEQHPEFYVASAYALNSYYDQLGLEAFSIPNTGMQNAITKKSRNDYFTSISYAFNNDEYVFNGKLVRTKDGETITDIDVTNKNIYLAIDQIKEQILNVLQPSDNKDIKVSNNLILPASTLISSNEKALELLTKSRISYITNPNDLSKAIELSKQSIESDPVCSQCHLNVATPLIALGRRDEATKHLKNAIKYAASLPKRMQFSAKELYYNLTNNADAGIKLQEFRKEMFPYDFSPYRALLPIYKMNYGIDKTKELMQNAIDNGNRERGLLELFKLLMENEEFEKAKVKLDQYCNEFPERDQDKLRYADLYEKQGKINEAKSILLKEEALNPFDIKIQTRIALLDFRNLDINVANERMDNAISEANSLTDSLQVLRLKILFNVLSGETKKGSNLIEKYEANALKQDTRLNILFSNLSLKYEIFQSTNQLDGLNKLLKEINGFLPLYEQTFKCQINNNAIVNGYQMTMDREAFTSCEKVFQSYGEGYNNYYNLLASYIDQDYSTCINIIEQDGNRLKKVFQGEFFIADIYYKGGDKKKAIDLLQKAINQKTLFPANYLKLAEIFEENDKIKSKHYLDLALKFWKNADAEFIPLQRAKALKSKLALQL